jgi:uncharacterized protein (TIGR04551 family)
MFAEVSMRRPASASPLDPACPDGAQRLLGTRWQPRSGLRAGPTSQPGSLAGATRVGLGLLLASLLVGGSAHAQFGGAGPGGMNPMGGMGGPQGGPPPDKPEGPAEAAPSTGPVDAAIEPLPQWPDKKGKELQFFQLNGYLRGRGFFWHNFNLGHFNDPSVGANPFTPPYSEIPKGPNDPSDSSCAKRTGNASCTERGIRTADMRLRLEPTLNLSEQIRVKAQLDIFDNLVLGSTPEGFYINGRGGTADGYPTINSRGQQPSESVVNALQSSIRAKRAWGEVKIPLVEINFGRMPFMWGSGMLFHDGNCNDCDFGTTVDRIMLTARLWNHFASFAYDWAATGPTSAIVNNQQLLGWQYNIDNVDDVQQITFTIGRVDDPQKIQDSLTRGKAVFNYGALLMGRWQDWDLTYNPRPQATPGAGMADRPELFYDIKELQKSLGRRAAWTLTTDVWARILYKKFYLEVEGAANWGQIGELCVNADATYCTGPNQANRVTMKLQQLGGVMRGNYKFLKDSLIVGLEVGSASGAQNGDPRGELNWRRARESPNAALNADGIPELRSSRFTFDPDYHVDLILFRRILGTVYNATYMKPSITYWLIDSFGGQAEFIYSLANRPATLPGHAINMGAEINLRIMYHNRDEGFYTSLEYGVLWDLGALSQRQDIWGTAINGNTAQAFQAKILLKF